MCTCYISSQSQLLLFFSPLLTVWLYVPLAHGTEHTIMHASARANSHTEKYTHTQIHTADAAICFSLCFMYDTTSGNNVFA